MLWNAAFFFDVAPKAVCISTNLRDHCGSLALSLPKNPILSCFLWSIYLEVYRSHNITSLGWHNIFKIAKNKAFLLILSPVNNPIWIVMLVSSNKMEQESSRWQRIPVLFSCCWHTILTRAVIKRDKKQKLFTKLDAAYATCVEVEFTGRRLQC